MYIFSKENLIKNNIISASYKKIFESVPTHIHDCFEIEYIISGTGTYKINEKIFSISDNMLFFMSPASFHSIENLDAEIINIMFPCSICNTNTLFNLFFSDIDCLKIDQNNIWINNIFNEIIVGCQNKQYDHSISFLQSLLFKLNTMSPSSSKIFSTYIQSAIIFILENFQKNISLNIVAEHIGIVPSYLSTLFLREVHMNFKTYLDNIRFDHAIRLLTFTNTSITEICQLSGFADYTNFGRRFKEKYGVSPRDYRNLHS